MAVEARLYSLDSCIAVATAMIWARSPRPILWAASTMCCALFIWVWSRPAAGAAVAVVAMAIAAGAVVAVWAVAVWAAAAGWPKARVRPVMAVARAPAAFFGVKSARVMSLLLLLPCSAQSSLA